MGEPRQPDDQQAQFGQLNSWKEIAAYLGREVRTIQRWEKEEGLPIHRHLHATRSSVYAIRSELDTWLRSRSALVTPVASDAPPGEARRLARGKAIHLSFVIAIVIAAAGGGWLYAVRDKREQSPSVPVPLTTYPGRELSPALSPDGDQIAFAWNGDQPHNFDIYVKQLGTYTAHRLSSHPNPEYSPAWSPDGRRIAFLRDLEDDRAAIIVIPSQGGPETQLTETYATPRLFGSGGELPLNSLSWSPDGKWLAISDRDSANEPFNIYVVSIDSGRRQKLTSAPPTALGDFSAVFSPDGFRIAFSRSTVVLVNEIYVVSLSTGMKIKEEPRRLTSDGQWNIGPAWTSDGTRLVYSQGSSYYSSQLFQIAVAGHSMPQRLGFIGENGSTPSVARSGNRLAYVRTSLDCDLYGLPLVGTARQSPAAPVVRATSVEGNGDYSPDGRRIAYFSTRSGYGEIWISRSDGSDPSQLTFFRELGAGTPRWSPDGKQIVFDSRSDGAGDIWVMNVEPRSPARRVTTHAASDLVPSWSRDGKWIYFASNRTGQFQVWKIPATGGTEIQVTRYGGSYAIESPDESTLFYAKSPVKSSSPGPSLWTVPVSGGEETKVLEALQNW